MINHIQERLMLEPSIFTYNLLNSYINNLGRKYGSKNQFLKSMKRIIVAIIHLKVKFVVNIKIKRLEEHQPIL